MTFQQIFPLRYLCRRGVKQMARHRRTLRWKTNPALSVKYLGLIGINGNKTRLFSKKQSLIWAVNSNLGKGRYLERIFWIRNRLGIVSCRVEYISFLSFPSQPLQYPSSSHPRSLCHHLVAKWKHIVIKSVLYPLCFHSRRSLPSPSVSVSLVRSPVRCLFRLSFLRLARGVKH